MTHSKLRKLAAAILLLVITGSIASIFWYNEWIFSLPTPVPQHYKNVPNGTFVDVGSQIGIKEPKPLFIHFFNPDCPCSKFNLKEFKALVKQNAEKVNFAVVVLSKKDLSIADIKEKIGLDLPITINGNLAENCGVYSTPQAVILDNNSKLFYRGNYNRSRYCTDKKTSFAQIALNALLNKEKNYKFNKLALQAYGCTLPNCSE